MCGRDTEERLGPHPATLIHRGLALTVGRELIPAGEVADLLLDLQSSVEHWGDCDEPDGPAEVPSVS